MALTIAFCYDRKSDYSAQGLSEEELSELDSDITIDEISKAISQLGHTIIHVGNIKSLVKLLAANEKPKWDLVFNITEGLYGVAREAQVPALLEAYQIPFTFSDAATLSVCLDKAKTKLVLEPYGIPTAPFAIVPNSLPSDKLSKNRGSVAVASSPFSKQLQFPLFAKPVAEGSSKGILPGSKIDGPETLDSIVDLLCERFSGQNILIEKYLAGREFTVGLVGSGSNARVVGAVEIITAKDIDFMTHSIKNDFENEVHVELSDPEVKAACDIALRVYKELGCRDAGRVDMRSDKKGDGAIPHFMEINPLAGLRPNYSQLPILAANNNIPHLKLIEIIIQSASERIKK